MLKPVLGSSRDSVPLKLKSKVGDNIVSHDGSFEPGFDPCKISLDNTFNNPNPEWLAGLFLYFGLDHAVVPGPGLRINFMFEFSKLI